MGSSPVEEIARLACVHRYDILDTPPDGSFDHLTAMAASLFDVPIAIISLVDHDRIWFKSHHGLDVKQIGRVPGLCASAIMGEGPWLVTDAGRDPRTLSNPLVAGEFGLQFYLGIPLRTADGYNLGTLCVIDRQPRTVTDAQVARLAVLAQIVMDQMELRLSARAATRELQQEAVRREQALTEAGFMASELEHRVRNSLQLVATYLSSQAMTASHREVRSELQIASGRVSAIARVHDQVTLEAGKNHSDLPAYLDQLCLDLSAITDIEVLLTASESASSMAIATELIVPVGLIVNELVTNAAKCGATAIQVSINRHQLGVASLAVLDDAGGLPGQFDLERSEGLGMRVVANAVKRLKGSLSHGQTYDGQGAIFTVLFPVPAVAGGAHERRATG